MRICSHLGLHFMRPLDFNPELQKTLVPWQTISLFRTEMYGEAGHPANQIYCKICETRTSSKERANGLHNEEATKWKDALASLPVGGSVGCPIPPPGASSLSESRSYSTFFSSGSGNDFGSQSTCWNNMKEQHKGRTGMTVQQTPESVKPVQWFEENYLGSCWGWTTAKHTQDSNTAGCFY